jgi:hypothetical protein
MAGAMLWGWWVVVGGWTLRPISAHVLPVVWEDESIPVPKRAFPSDHGAVVIDLEWERVAETRE